jgi:CubicO group peptidase (beta-lactamase class C family)
MLWRAAYRAGQTTSVSPAMRSRNLLLAGGVVLVLVMAALSWRLLWGGGPDHELTAPEDLDAVVDAIEGAVPDAQRNAHVPGVAVAVIEGDEIAWDESFGVPAGTVFQAGSISKPVAVAAILSLAQDGMLDLDAAVSTYLRSWRLPDDFPNPDAVTLRHLLSHTAGIDTSGYEGLPADRPLPTTDESLQGAATGTPVRQSGTPGKYAYSGGGYTIAQQVIEDVTGEPFATVVRREVLDPLGMSSSGYECTQDVSAAQIATPGHEADGAEAPHYRYAEAAAAGLCSTADDLARFAAWLGSPAPRAEAMRAAAPGADGDYGLGVELGDDTVGHVGINRGFHAELLVNPDARVGLVVLTNGDRGGEVVEAVLEAWHDAA